MIFCFQYLRPPKNMTINKQNTYKEIPSYPLQINSIAFSPIGTNNTYSFANDITIGNPVIIVQALNGTGINTFCCLSCNAVPAL